MQDFDFQRKLEVVCRPAVLVIGGGVAGLCAALAAARNGAHTMLVEQGGFCGGMATAGLVAPFMTCYDSGGTERLIRGLFEEIVDRMCALGGAIQPSEIDAGTAFTSYIKIGHLHVTPFKAETLKIVADRMLIEAGVQVLYHTAFVAAERSGSKITRVIVHRKQGLCGIEPKVVIDCTGDADVAADAGVPFTLGNADGKLQPATMFFRIGNVDSNKIQADIERNKDNFFRRDGVNYRSLHWWVEKARQAGDWTLDRVSVGLFRGVDPDEWSINTSRIMGVDGTSSESLTHAELEGRRQAEEIFRFLVKYVPGCENARLLETGSTVGIRETRHISGLRRLTLDDLLGCSIPDDSIMLAANSVDVHGKFGPRSNEYIALPAGKYYGVPYGTMVPVGLENLLVAGHAVSADSEAAGAIRVMPPCMALGQAAGVAAAMAVSSGTPLDSINVSVLRRRLTDQGVRL